MIVSIELKSFRGISESFQFTKANEICGRNGSRKSTIKEAINFAFTGSDSTGGKLPTHFISRGEDSCFVRLTTEKVVIQRTLTAKKNSTLTITRGGIKSSLTQKQFEGMLGCSADCFMSVFLPGFYWTLPSQRQMDLLNALMPKFDVMEFIKARTGQEPTDIDTAFFGICSKRPDISASAVAGTRREVQRQKTLLEGRLLALKAGGDQPPVVPPPSSASARLQHADNLRAEHREYREAMRVYKQEMDRLDQATAEAESNLKMVGELKTRLEETASAMIPLPNPEELAVLRRRLEALEAKKPLPSSPALANEVLTESCPTCGQTVGLKHREKVRAANLKLSEEHSRVCAEILATNSKIDTERQEIQKAIEVWTRDNSRIEAHNNLVVMQRYQLEVRIAELSKPKPMPEVRPAPPPPPIEPEPDETAYRELKAEVARVAEQVAQYKLLLKQYDTRSAEIQKIESECRPLANRIDYLAALEAALLELPGARLRFQLETLSIPGYLLTITDTPEVKLTRESDSCPRELLSTGEAIKADIQFSLKINSLLKNPVGIMFVDNADLVDERTVPPNLQVFYAVVDSGSDLRITQL